MFSAFHASSTWQVLRTRQIGTCEDAVPDPLLEDFRRLRADMQTARMFESNKLYYVWKVWRWQSPHPARTAHSLNCPLQQCVSNLAICALSFAVLRASDGFAALFTSALLMVRAGHLRNRLCQHTFGL